MIEKFSPVSGKIELTYKTKDTAGEDVLMTRTIDDLDPTWISYLCRHVDNHRTIGLGRHGASSISLQGSFGEHPAVEQKFWHPHFPFLG
jgi:hypothetical protein